MATKGWQGRQAILTILNGGTDSDVLDLGAMESVQQTAVALTTGSTTTNIVTSSIVIPTSGQAAVVTTDCFKGKAVVFRSDTTTANLRNQKQLISANTSAGVLTTGAFTVAPSTGDVFDITDLEEARSYRRWDIQICSPATVTGTINAKISNSEAGTYSTQNSGGSAIVIPTVNVATPR